MLFIYTNGHYQIYHKIPKKLKRQHPGLELLFSILQTMSDSHRSCYYFNSWQTALKAAWNQGIKKDLIDYFCCKYHLRYHKSDAVEGRDRTLSQFLQQHIGEHLWASNPRSHPELFVSRTNVLNDRLLKKAKKAQISQFFQYGEEIRNHHELLHAVYCPFMVYLSSHSNQDDKFQALLQIHSHNSVMNCEQFVTYTLCSVGLIKEIELKIIFSACAVEHGLDILYNALGFDNRQAISAEIHFDSFTESQILFECNAQMAARQEENSSSKREVSHVLLYAHADRSIYELSFGDTEEEWRVKRMSVAEYCLDFKKRNKQVAATALSKMNLAEALDYANTVLACAKMETSAEEMDLVCENYLF
ncbi:hypothetical protein EAS68_13050 [Legionella jordanis]|uniref:hypothetical protein n=1 Tax=Legionella jordanis TaxID=456 RepID=UPI000EFE6454|nr:hypothetical protein [Legionella jordanis]RMX15110.1 hypothetical protein EAS68_13050 [Legionella jordanis]